MRGGSVYFCAIPLSSPVQNELYLATPHFSLFVLKLLLPNRKAEVCVHYLFWNFHSQIKKRKLICHNLFWNKPKSRPPFILEVAKFPNRKADAKTERSLTCKVPAHCRVNAASGRWSYGHDLCRVTYEGIHVHRLTSSLNIHKAF